MSKMIQIRHVPEPVHRKLKARAAEAGMSLSDYLLREVERLAGRPSVEEVLGRIRAREPVELDEDPAAMIRRIRDAS